MNSNRLIAILGLLLLLILAIGSISAADADMDSDSIGDSLANIDLIEEGQSVETEDSTLGIVLDDDSNIDEANADTISNVEDIVDDDIISAGDGDDSISPNLGSTYAFKSSNYATYFNSSGNIISGKLKSGDVLDCSGSFNKLTFVINIPITITSTDGTAKFNNCEFKIVNGAQGTNISNLKANIDKLDTPIFDVFNVSDISIANCNLFSNASHSYPILFNIVNSSNIINNTVKTSCNVVGWGHPSAIVLSDTFYNNISNNNVITNDSNGIYLTGYLGGGSMGQSGGGVNAYNYIFNNTVHSIRGVEWALDENGKTPLPSSFSYGIQVMGAFNDIINNTVYNVYRGISATQSGNKIIGNTLYNIHGTWYSGNTNDEGGDYAIYATTKCLVKDNIISDSKINASGAAIYVSKDSNVTGNILRNITGTGIEIGSSNILIMSNEINASMYGIHAIGNMGNVVISNNSIDSINSTIKLEKKSRQLYPHDFIIQNNTLHSTDTKVIDVDSYCTNILRIDNIGDDGSQQSGDNETVHYIIDTNFYNYFSLSGNLASNVKENDTLIFMNSFRSKGKLYINNKVRIQGIDAVFNDTTFIVEDDDVIIENITINNPNLNNMDRLWGIQVNGVNNVTIQNCSISIYDPYSAYAIYLLEASNCTIVNNTLEARGNYFTAAVLSFNSHNILLDGNILKTVGCGETYLINNKSCLDGYLNIYANTCVDGTIVCPDGYTICPDGSLLCPDGAVIDAENYRICVDGSVVCVDGTIICADGSTIAYTDSDICADGSVCVDGVTYCLDGTITLADGTRIVAGGYQICLDGSIVCPDGTVLSSDNYELCTDGSIVCPDGTTICADGSIICTDGTTICADGSIICADGTTICPDGNVICADGTVVCPDGSVVCPDGTVYGPGEYTTCVDGSILCPDGTVIYPNGTIVCADGTTICPDGSGSSTILDGVIPGSHMVSGLYRTYGFLMVHSSEITFTNNNVTVGSALGEDYDLNESYNTIAGVFIHYGGFNNTISNNNIVLSSNDPIIYGIGIIGAPMGSTAVGSLNNAFTYNNVSINGSYLTVGLFLGNKVFESDIEFNSFNIISGRESPNIVNYNSSANNTIENNVFDSTLATLFEYEDIVVTIQEANENTLFFKVVLKDKEGNVLANKVVTLTFNDSVNEFVTDENGSATLELNIKEAGTYDILMNFAGDDKYFAASAIGTVTVRKFNPSITVGNVSYKTTDGNKVLTATLMDEDGLALVNKTIKFTVNGKDYTATSNENGIATVKITLTAGGTYVISANYAGDEEHEEVTGTGKLTLSKQSTSLASSGKTYIVTNTAKYISVTLKDGAKKLLANKKVTATVNGKTFSAKTNSKGVAKIKLTLNAAKTYKVSIKFAGDSTYSASTKSITVKVTKTKTKLAVPSKTYKAAAKTKKLTATLKDQTGKAVKSKKVTFTVNGKKYTAKTNAKGLATVSAKLTAKKTYKFTVKFAGDSKYYAVTKAAKVTIK